MSITLGVDVGGSTTKIVGFQQDGSFLGTLQVKADDQITSLYGAIGGFLREHKVSLPSVCSIVLTGVGASLITENIFDIPTYKVDEFKAIGWGGLMLSQLKEAIVVSVGTCLLYTSRCV